MFSLILVTLFQKVVLDWNLTTSSSIDLLLVFPLAVWQTR
jgi:hypothetical protein